MTKDLSRQLCELAELKPKYRYKHTGQIYTSEELKDEIFHLGFTKFDYEEIYPNFETSENFVKLLECLFQFPFVCEEKETYMKSILCGTIEKLEKQECADLKQALQAQDFKY